MPEDLTDSIELCTTPPVLNRKVSFDKLDDKKPDRKGKLKRVFQSHASLDMQLMRRRSESYDQSHPGTPGHGRSFTTYPTEGNVLYNEGDVQGELHVIEMHRGCLLKTIYRCCPYACPVNTLEFIKLTLPGYTRNFDQISDFIVFLLFYDKFFFLSMLLFILALLAVSIRWYVSLRNVKIESISRYNFIKRAFLFVYIIPIFGSKSHF